MAQIWISKQELVTALKDTFLGPFLNMIKMNSTSKYGIRIDRTGGVVGVKSA